MSIRNRAFALIVASALLGSASAEAAGFTISPSGQIGPRFPSQTTTLAGRPPCSYCGPKSPPPLPHSAANDPFDASKNLNPGSGGGGGLKPGKKPILD